MRTLSSKGLVYLMLGLVGIGILVFLPYLIGSPYLSSDSDTNISYFLLGWIGGFFILMVGITALLLLGLCGKGIYLLFDWLFSKRKDQ